MTNRTQVLRVPNLDTAQNLAERLAALCDQKLDEDFILAATFTFRTDLVLIFQPIQSRIENSVSDEGVGAIDTPSPPP